MNKIYFTIKTKIFNENVGIISFDITEDWKQPSGVPTITKLTEAKVKQVLEQHYDSDVVINSFEYIEHTGHCYTDFKAKITVKEDNGENIYDEIVDVYQAIFYE